MRAYLWPKTERLPAVTTRRLKESFHSFRKEPGSVWKGKVSRLSRRFREREAQLINLSAAFQQRYLLKPFCAWLRLSPPLLHSGHRSSGLPPQLRWAATVPSGPPLSPAPRRGCPGAVVAEPGERGRPRAAIGSFRVELGVVGSGVCCTLRWHRQEEKFPRQPAME